MHYLFLCGTLTSSPCSYACMHVKNWQETQTWALSIDKLTHFFRSKMDTRFPTGLITEFPSFEKFRFPWRYTVPSRFENWGYRQMFWVKENLNVSLHEWSRQRERNNFWDLTWTGKWFYCLKQRQQSPGQLYSTLENYARCVEILTNYEHNDSYSYQKYLN